MRDFRFVPNPPGIAELLHQPTVSAYTAHVTDQLRATAQAGSPRKTGHFADSFGVSTTETPGGLVGSLHNSDPGATAIELGSVNNPPFAPMRRACRTLGLKLHKDKGK